MVLYHPTIIFYVNITVRGLNLYCTIVWNLVFFTDYSTDSPLGRLKTPKFKVKINSTIANIQISVIKFVICQIVTRWQTQDVCEHGFEVSLFGPDGKYSLNTNFL